MYSRNARSRENGTFGEALPPGYDGSRFSRRRRGETDEIIVVPDSEFVLREDTPGSAELSRNGIVSAKSEPQGKDGRDDEKMLIADSPKGEKRAAPGLDRILGSFASELTDEDILLLALIFMLSAESERGSGEDIVIPLALLLAIR